MGTFSVHTNNLLLDGSLISYQIRNWIEVSNGCTVRTSGTGPQYEFNLLESCWYYNPPWEEFPV